jgi:hypothetical protein
VNSNPYAWPALVAGILLVLTLGGGFLVIHYAERPVRGRHARNAAPPEPPPLPAAGRLPMLPDGPGGPSGPDEPDEASPPGWWDREPPPPAVEVLARMRDALLPDAWKPEPGMPAFTPADPDATCTDLAPVTGAPEYLAAPHG